VLRWLPHFVAFALVLGATACNPAEESETSTPSATETEPEAETTATTPGEAEGEAGSAEALVESQCSLCHTTERVWAAEYDRAQWEATMDRMKANGLVISDEDYETIVVYLSGE